jgi:hypothetical protein
LDDDGFVPHRRDPDRRGGRKLAVRSPSSSSKPASRASSEQGTSETDQ